MDIHIKITTKNHKTMTFTTGDDMYYEMLAMYEGLAARGFQAEFYRVIEKPEIIAQSTPKW